MTTNLLDWSQIDTVLLDMDGTLLDLHFDSFFWFEHLPKRYAESHHVSLDEAKAFIEFNVNKYRGTLNWYCLDHWSKLAQLDIPALKREIKHKIQIRPHVEPFLTALKNLNKRLILITNAHRKGLDTKLEISQIDQFLDVIISSHDFGSPKESQTFWQQLMIQEHFDTSRTVFIDDSPNILESAQKFGIEHLVCINMPDSQQPAVRSNQFIDICHFDERMPEEAG